MTEGDIQRAIMIATSHQVDWWRNNVGSYDANPRCPHCGQRANPTSGARWIRYGVGGPGGADLIGIVRGTGILLAAEIKTTRGRVSEDQQVFGRRVANDGAIYVVARDAADVLDALSQRGLR